MNHIDEHTIEMYVLGSELVMERRGEIEAHFKECHGCRTLAEQMEVFYQKAEEGLEEVNPERAKSKALVRSRAGLPTMQEPYGFPAHYQPTTPLAKVFYFIRRHPVSVGVTSFAMVAALGWFLNDAIRNFSSDKVIQDQNPDYTSLNSASDKLEVYNKNNVLLWSLPLPDAASIQKYENYTNMKLTALADLNGDGKNEVLTVLHSIGNRTVEKKNVLLIYSSNKQDAREIPFGRAFQFRNRQYQNDFNTCALLVSDFKKDGSKEIIVSVNNTHSPSFVSRLDNKGNVIGEYWHFGQIRGLYAVDLNSDGKKEIILCASNDVEDDVHHEYPVVIVLDPEKIINPTESSCTPGFNLPASEAELFYIRIPRTDIDDVTLSSPVMRSLSSLDNQMFRFVTQSVPVKEYESFQFDYIFSNDLRIVDVKSNNDVDQLHATLAQKGKLTGKIDKTYLDNLKHSVRYWNGKEWRKEWTMVLHDGENFAKR